MFYMLHLYNSRFGNLMYLYVLYTYNFRKACLFCVSVYAHTFVFVHTKRLHSETVF